MVTRITSGSLNVSEFTPETIVSLYLYGTKTPPQNLYDRIKPESFLSNLTTLKDEQGNFVANVVNMAVDGQAYLDNGAGRFATPAEFELVKIFFEGFNNFFFNLDPGSYTYDQLNDKVTFFTQLTGGHDNRLVIEQLGRNDGKDNGVDRPFIFNNTSFTLQTNQNAAQELRFVVTPAGERYIENVAIRTFDDNFDFVGGSFASVIFNAAEAGKYDPYRIGHRVEFDYNNNNLTVDPKYTLNDYNQHLQFIADTSKQVATNSDSDKLRERLEAKEILLYEKSGYSIVYGTYESQQLHAVTELLSLFSKPSLILAGEGADKVTGGSKSDRLYGHEGNDDLFGLDEADYLFGGSGGRYPKIKTPFLSLLMIPRVDIVAQTPPVGA